MKKDRGPKEKISIPSNIHKQELRNTDNTNNAIFFASQVRQEGKLGRV